MPQECDSMNENKINVAGKPITWRLERKTLPDHQNPYKGVLLSLASNHRGGLRWLLSLSVDHGTAVTAGQSRQA